MSLRYLLPGLLLVFGLVMIAFQVAFIHRIDVGDSIRSVTQRATGTGTRLGRLLGRLLDEGAMKTIHGEVSHTRSEEDMNVAMLVDARGSVISAKEMDRIGKPVATYVPPEMVDMITLALRDGAPIVEATMAQDSVLGVFPVLTGNGVVTHALLIDIDLKRSLRIARHQAALHAGIGSLALVIACGGLWIMLDALITKRVTSILRAGHAMITGRSVGAPLRGQDELALIDGVLRDSHALILRQAEGLRAQDKRYRMMVESLPAMVFISRNYCIEYMNQTGLNMLGIASVDRIRGTSPLDFIPPAFHPRIKERAREIFESGATAPAEEEEIIRGDGRVIAVETVASVFTDAQGPAIQVIMHDITERKAAEARRDALGREITNASEREQRRIGQDLHDDICQRLAAVKMAMQDLEESLAEHAPALMGEADAIVDRLTDAIGITRSLARGLSPVDIEAGGLGVALTGLARSTQQFMGVSCELELPDDLPPLSPHAATQFYRIAQECINNAVRHGLARQVRVQLFVEHATLVLRVSNDGAPFDPNATGSQGMGLPIMRHRAQSMDATLDFEQHPMDAPVAVRCSLPQSDTQSLPTSHHHEKDHR